MPLEGMLVSLTNRPPCRRVLYSELLTYPSLGSAHVLRTTGDISILVRATNDTLVCFTCDFLHDAPQYWCESVDRTPTAAAIAVNVLEPDAKIGRFVGKTSGTNLEFLLRWHLDFRSIYLTSQCSLPLRI